MKRAILILLVLVLSFGECEAQRKRKRHKRNKYNRERVSVHRVTTKEKIIFGTIAVGLLWWSYRD